MSAFSAERRDVLKWAGAASFAPVIAKALEASPNRQTGTLRDVEHVVILMQENRSFDHYFGSLRGVRGFDDPRAIKTPSGEPVWRQKAKDGKTYTPFHLDAATTRAQTIMSLDHSWKGTHEAWKNYDHWAALKTPLTMGYFTRDDLPFYYALADAFTICDAYHASIHGPTNPNRLFLFSGTSGLSVGRDGKIVVENPPEEPNETADPRNDARAFPGLDWTTYAERLQKAGVSWKLYQEYDNYGDNGLAYFAKFRGLDPASPLYQKGRAWVEGSTPENAKTSDGEHLVAAFEADIAAGRLPQVSWIVAPYKLCEHPSASPAAGEWFTARLIKALADHPDIWAKTVFVLNYDENDGFFDHVPPPTPPVRAELGQSTVSMVGEDYHGVPVGLGPRVPLLVVSPWTKGGYVNSQIFDHTSVLRFLEARFGVLEPQISPWRRCVCGDLTSLFDFKAPASPAVVSRLPDASELPGLAEAAKALPFPKPYPEAPMARQEMGRRPTRPLPYAFRADAKIERGTFVLRIENRGTAGAAFRLASDLGDGPYYYTVEAGKSIEARLPATALSYSYSLMGPNGFSRTFQGSPTETGPELEAVFDRGRGGLKIRLRGGAEAFTEVALVSHYDPVGSAPRTFTLKPGQTLSDWVDIAEHDNWYDFSLTVKDRPEFVRRYTGHEETGLESRSDPAIGKEDA